MKMLRYTFVWLVSLALVACGGGGGSEGTSSFGGGGTTGGTGSTSSATLLMAISTTTVTSAAAATVSATVRDAAGAAVPGQVVSFSSSGSLGAFTPASALTNSSGVATVQLSPASATANGADLVVAKATVGTTAVSGTIGFQVVASSIPPSGNPTLAVSLSAISVSAAAPGSFTATLKDAAGGALQGQVVKFSSVDNLGAFNPSSALTDATGRATVSLVPASSTSNGSDLALAQATVNGTLLTATAGFTAVAGSTPPSGAPSLSLSLSTTTVTTSTPATVTAVVRNASGVGVSGQVVSFSTVDGLGTFAVTSALTDSTGSASVTLNATSAGSSGADQVVAKATVNGTALQATQGFQLTANNVALASFVSDIGTGTLSAYGQSNLTATISGAASGTTVNVAVSSACVAKGKATLTPATVSTTTGTAIFTYRDNGCGATDTADSLQASIVGTTANAPLSIRLASPTAGSITFISANPPTIFLKGSGLTETATVLFRVLDGAGNGLPNQSVDLEASTLAGGLTIDSGPGPLTKLTDSLGNVSVIVNSGTVPTPVRVKASLTGGSITTVSSSLAIAVGKPSQLNFSLSQQTLNIEAANRDGTPNTYSIIASDRLGNPVPAGTAINFVTEGGQIEAAKFTTLVNGLARASANFISSSPRPADMRVTVLAYALGEESFLDTNGDNVWNAGEPFQDLGNVYLDRLFNGTYDSAEDQFIALSIPGVGSSQACAAVTSPLLALDASIPSVGGSTCDGTWGPAYVRRAIETVFSTSSARPLWLGVPNGLYSISGASCANHVVGPLVTGYDTAGQPQSQSFIGLDGGTAVYNAGTTGSLIFIAADANAVRLNPMAAGTTIAATSTTGVTVKVAGSPVPSTLEASLASVTYTFAAGTSSGTISLLFTSPSGVQTAVDVAVSTGAAPGTATICP